MVPVVEDDCEKDEDEDDNSQKASRVRDDCEEHEVDDNLQKESICYNIYVLEHTILACLRQHVNKKVKMSIYEEMVQKNLQHSNQTMYLKISGVWEDTTYIGLVYKLYYTMSTVKFSNMIC